MKTGLIYDERFLDHDTGPVHPERPDRLRAIVRKLRDVHLWDELLHLPFEPASIQAIARVHAPAYIQRVEAFCASGKRNLDGADTTVCPLSYDLALLASGGVLAACDAVMAGQVANACCLVRPPGHHAEYDRAMGFCLFNHVAIAAEHLRAVHGLERIAIVDVDVHHGNGTQHHFESRRDVLFISFHEDPRWLYPGTGFAVERGFDEGAGYTVNIPLPPRSGDEVFRHAFNAQVLPRIEQFNPQFLLISAGFDATTDDPLAHLELTPQGYRWLTEQLKRLAESCCQGRLVSTLEGGYDLRALAECAALHLQTLMQPAGHDEHMAMKAGL